mmetsp:Transcript_7077/g.19414  ORF Transcript_7077/g.19414 Transcript_7077/m.19414 type:complete len:536 (-) Transcript_7077:543-2150(-)
MDKISADSCAEKTSAEKISENLHPKRSRLEERVDALRSTLAMEAEQHRKEEDGLRADIVNLSHALEARDQETLALERRVEELSLEAKNTNAEYKRSLGTVAKAKKRLRVTQDALKKSIDGEMHFQARLSGLMLDGEEELVAIPSPRGLPLPALNDASLAAPSTEGKAEGKVTKEDHNRAVLRLMRPLLQDCLPQAPEVIQEMMRIADAQHSVLASPSSPHVTRECRPRALKAMSRERQSVSACSCSSRERVEAMCRPVDSVSSPRVAIASPRGASCQVANSRVASLQVGSPGSNGSRIGSRLMASLRAAVGPRMASPCRLQRTARHAVPPPLPDNNRIARTDVQEVHMRPQTQCCPVPPLLLDLTRNAAMEIQESHDPSVVVSVRPLVARCSIPQLGGDVCRMAFVDAQNPQQRSSTVVLRHLPPRSAVPVPDPCKSGARTPPTPPTSEYQDPSMTFPVRPVTRYSLTLAVDSKRDEVKDVNEASIATVAGAMTDRHSMPAPWAGAVFRSCPGSTGGGVLGAHGRVLRSSVPVRC